MIKNIWKSFTLIEILVYLAVFSVIIALIISFLLWMTRSNTKTKVMRETLNNAERVMEVLAHEIKESESVYLPTTNSNQLSLKTKKYLPEGENESYIDFYLCDSRICLKKESQDPIFLTPDSVEVNSLVFTQILSGDSSSVQVDLSVDYKNPTARPEYQASVNLTSTTSLRNY